MRRSNISRQPASGSERQWTERRRLRPVLAAAQSSRTVAAGPARMPELPEVELVRLIDSASALAADPFLRRLGPEPVSEAFTLAGFRAQLERRRRAPVKAVILDQSVVAGVGNIYADESLHLARIHPLRRAGELERSESRRLHAATRRIIELATDSGGTSFADYGDPDRRPTGYVARTRVFSRQHRPCPVCDTTIERVRVAGRSTNFCPRCQPPPDARRVQRVVRRSVAW